MDKCQYFFDMIKKKLISQKLQLKFAFAFSLLLPQVIYLERCRKGFYHEKIDISNSSYYN